MRFSRTMTLTAALIVLAAAGCSRHKAKPPSADRGQDDAAERSEAPKTARLFLEAGRDERWDRTAELSRCQGFSDRPWPGDGVECPPHVRDGWRGRAFHDWDNTMGDLLYLPVKGTVLALVPVGGAHDSNKSILVALERGSDGLWAVCDLLRLDPAYVDALSPEPPPGFAAQP